MRVAAYQAPLLPSGHMEVIELLRPRIAFCEDEGIGILCCPEALFGGLADDVTHPVEIALSAANGQLETALAPLASETVAVIVGFTEITDAGHLFNSAAIVHHGLVQGVYRKRHPAIRRSVYRAGEVSPVFTFGGLMFGIAICNDSNFPELAIGMAALGAQALFIPSNNCLQPAKADVVAESRRVDVATTRSNGIAVIRADVAGRSADRMSYGSSCIVDRNGQVLQSAQAFTEELLVAEIDTGTLKRSGGPQESRGAVRARS